MAKKQNKQPLDKTTNKAKQIPPNDSEQATASTSELPMDGFRYDYNDNV